MFLQEFTVFTFRDVETPIILPSEGIPLHQETLEVRVAVLAFTEFFLVSKLNLILIIGNRGSA
jgi:hypothetical protein